MPIDLVEIDAGALENGDELRMGAEPDAAARQFLIVALEHRGVPADRAQQMRDHQPAERAADHRARGDVITRLIPGRAEGASPESIITIGRGSVKVLSQCPTRQ